MEKGYLALVLHAHLPFVRHPEYEDFLEEDWFFEAVTETYLPLIDIMTRLVTEKVHFRLTMSLTPPLCAMLSDPLLQSRYRRYLGHLIELSEKEVHRTRNQPAYQDITRMYHQKLTRCRQIYEDWYRGNLLQAFRQLQNQGVLEIVTCAATHGYLPLMIHRQAARAQIRVAADDYQRHFGRRPRGVWLAECAYNPGDDTLLKEAGIRYFFMDAHGLLYGTPRPRYGVYAPAYCPSGVAAFARDMESAHQVWSAEIGYPGDPVYREFYRDVGYDLDYDTIKPYLHSDGVRRNVGLKYHRITGKVPLNAKELYNPAAAREKAAQHAGNFLFNRQKQVEHLYGLLQKKPVVLAMYDAELFGHWWYEGPDFLEFLFRKLHHDQKDIRMVTPSEYLEENPNNQIIQPEMSSWGDKGYHEVWLNGANDWIYRHLHKATELMIDLAEQNPSATGLRERALNQAARELYLAQSSDWAFLMTVGTATSYAQKRTLDHLNRFLALNQQIRQNTIDDLFLSEIERRDTIFPHLDYRVFRMTQQKAVLV
ncbi:MAG: glycoside hydrolase [Elusimicrobia bacterium RIFCSPLOWO2_01_FULL_59_12]|nr:MAG: glycoside hydrolase [Elusimicrobia bacterium RIFCSPLOWO2_01_FULL_59_12]